MVERQVIWLVTFGVLILAYDIGLLFRFWNGLDNENCGHKWRYFCLGLFVMVILFGGYIGVFKMIRLCCCKLYTCCGGNDKSNRGITCSICCEGIFGNPLYLGVAYTIFGVTVFVELNKSCSNSNFVILFLVILCSIGIFMLVFCVYYYYKVRTHWNRVKDRNNANEFTNAHNINMNRIQNNAGNYNDPRNRNLINQPPNNVHQINNNNNGIDSYKQNSNVIGKSLPIVMDQNIENRIQIDDKNNQNKEIKQKPIERRESVSVTVSLVIEDNNNNNNRNRVSQAQSQSLVNSNPQNIKNNLEKSDIHANHDRDREVSFPNEFFGVAQRASTTLINAMHTKHEECVICLGEFEHHEEIATLQCFHYFHKKCIIDWLRNQKPECPICNTPANIIKDS